MTKAIFTLFVYLCHLLLLLLLLSLLNLCPPGCPPLFFFLPSLTLSLPSLSSRHGLSLFFLSPSPAMSPRPCLRPSRLVVSPIVRPSLTSPSLRSSFHLPRSSAGGRPNYSSLFFFFSLLLHFLLYRSLTHTHTPVTQHDISQSFIHPSLLLLSPPSSASLFSLPPP